MHSIKLVFNQPVSHFMFGSRQLP